MPPFRGSPRAPPNAMQSTYSAALPFRSLPTRRHLNCTNICTLLLSAVPHGTRAGAYETRRKEREPWGRGCETRGHGFETRGRGFETRGDGFETRGHGFGTRGNAFGTRGNAFGTRGNAFGTRGNANRLGALCCDGSSATIRARFASSGAASRWSGSRSALPRAGNVMDRVRFALVRAGGALDRAGNSSDRVRFVADAT
jgi:hypothetical protein